MQKYDVLRDTWIYQEIKKQVQEDEYQQHLEEQRQMLLEIIHNRFPRIEPLAKQLAQAITEPTRLQTLIVKVSIARLEKDARQSLSEIQIV